MCYLQRHSSTPFAPVVGGWGAGHQGTASSLRGTVVGMWYILYWRYWAVAGSLKSISKCLFWLHPWFRGTHHSWWSPEYSNWNCLQIYVDPRAVNKSRRLRRSGYEASHTLNIHDSWVDVGPDRSVNSFDFHSYSTYPRTISMAPQSPGPGVPAASKVITVLYCSSQSVNHKTRRR